MDAPPVQYVTTSDGFDIAYAVCGQGTPLVRVPSLFGHFVPQWNRDVLARDFQALSNHFRLLLYDARGQGASTRGLAGATSLDDYVRDLELLVDRPGLKRFILLGVSAMGKVAVKYALKHPDRVIAIVLQEYTDISHGTRLGLWELAERDWPLLIQTSARVGWPWADPSTVAAILHDTITKADFLRLEAILGEEPGDTLLEQLEVPALVMATREEARPMGRDKDAKRIAAIIPNARLVLFDDVGGGFAAAEGTTPPGVAAIQRFVEEICVENERPRPPQQAAGLSAREIEVLHLLAAGKSNAQIAEALVISQNTVIRHVSNIFAKTGVANRTEAAGYATRHGLA